MTRVAMKTIVKLCLKRSSQYKHTYVGSQHLVYICFGENGRKYIIMKKFLSFVWEEKQEEILCS